MLDPLPLGAIECATERKLVTRMVAGMTDTMIRSYFPNGSSGYSKFHCWELVIVLLHVMQGHLSGRPVTAGSLARGLGVSPKTAQRWLCELIKLDLLARKGRIYCATARVNDPDVRRAVERNVKLILATADGLRLLRKQQNSVVLKKVQAK